MPDETMTAYPDEETIEAVNEPQLAQFLQELSGKRAALRDELGQLDDSIERLEIELARRGSGG